MCRQIAFTSTVAARRPGGRGLRTSLNPLQEGGVCCTCRLASFLLMPVGCRPRIEIGVSPPPALAGRRRLLGALECAYAVRFTPLDGRTTPAAVVVFGDTPSSLPDVPTLFLTDPREPGGTRREVEFVPDPLVPAPFRGRTFFEKGRGDTPARLGRGGHRSRPDRARGRLDCRVGPRDRLSGRWRAVRTRGGRGLAQPTHAWPVFRPPSACQLPPNGDQDSGCGPASVLRDRRPESPCTELWTCFVPDACETRREARISRCHGDDPSRRLARLAQGRVALSDPTGPALAARPRQRPRS